MRLFAGLLIFVFGYSTAAQATTCGRPPVCARVREGSILLTGIVIDSGSNAKETHPIQVRVQEIFAGLPAATKEIAVEVEGDWPAKGPVYLFDLGKDPEGRFFPLMCGNTGEADAEYHADLMTFLRDRAKGKGKTTLTVHAQAADSAVAGARVTIKGPSGTRSDQTNEKGDVVFDGILPGQYEIGATRQNYDSDPEYDAPKTVNLVPQSCAWGLVPLKVRTEVSGTLVDAIGRPVPNIKLTLVEPNQKRTLARSVTEETDASGNFRFAGVTPGAYQLGVSISISPDSPFPPTYYPGVRDSSSAALVYVTTEKNLTNLVFRLPDFGKPRTVTVCAIDEESKPVGGVVFNDDWMSFKGIGSAERPGRTDTNGCVSFQGYEKARYALTGSFMKSFQDLKNALFTEPVVIEPGEGPVNLTVLLKPLRKN